MHLKSFLKLVEIQTKAASIIPFLLGTFYALYRFMTFNMSNFFLMLVSLLCIDMATTAINNYQDFKRAYKKHGYGYESHNAIVRDNLGESKVLAAIFILLSLAVVSGILLFLNTNFVVLALGALSFTIGILYSFGPVPISRTPFGEVISGSFMGFIIPFIAVYIHVYNYGIVDIRMQGGLLNLQVNLLEILYIFLVSLPAAAGIANIMLANNICDIEDDLDNKRFTLPIYIGKSKSLWLFKTLYYLGFIALLILLLLRVVPLLSILTLITSVVINKHVNIFYQLQTKKDTFILAVKNFILVNGVLAITIGVSTILR